MSTAPASDPGGDDAREPACALPEAVVTWRELLKSKVAAQHVLDGVSQADLDELVSRLRRINAALDPSLVRLLPDTVTMKDWFDLSPPVLRLVGEQELLRLASEREVRSLGLWARIRMFTPMGLILDAAKTLFMILMESILLPARSPGRLTSLAVFLAGRKRPKTRAEFRSHMYDWSGLGLGRREQIRAARGLVLAALVMRLHDASELAWKPVDAVLGSRTLSGLFVWGPVMAVLVAIVHTDGHFGLVHDVDAPGWLGTFLYLAIKTGRWWRKIKLPDPKPRRAKE